jgi:hypothetical protein
MVVLQASIETIAGRTAQTEIYTLRRSSEGRWLIDHLAVKNEVTPWDQDAITQKRHQPRVTNAHR